MANAASVGKAAASRTHSKRWRGGGGAGGVLRQWLGQALEIGGKKMKLRALDDPGLREVW